MSKLRRLGEFLRLDGRILVTFLLLAIALFLFAKLASEVTEGQTMALDRQIMVGLLSSADASVPIGPRWLRVAMFDVTALRGASVLTLFTTIVAGYLIASRKLASAIFLGAAV